MRARFPPVRFNLFRLTETAGEDKTSIKVHSVLTFRADSIEDRQPDSSIPVAEATLGRSFSGTVHLSHQSII